MPAIDLGPQPKILPDETVCAPVSYVQTLTTSSNAITMGWYGFAAGLIAAAAFAVAYLYVAPWVVATGKVRGWWS